MVKFIDQHRAEWGVQPSCRLLPIAPSTCYAARARQADRSRGSARAQRDPVLSLFKTELIRQRGP
jgi:putative transposase